MKDERDSGLPGGLQGHVVHPLLGGAVVPEGKVGVAVRIVGWRPDLKKVITKVHLKNGFTGFSHEDLNLAKKEAIVEN